MLKLYAHPASPFSIRVQLFLEEIGEPYQYERIELSKGEQLAKPYKDVNPFKRVPAIDYNGFVLAESNAILRYLAGRFSRHDWYPQNLEARAVVDQWMDYAGFHAGTPLSGLAWERFWLPKFNQKGNDKEIAKYIKKIERELPIIDTHLQSQQFLAAANPTLADVTFLPLVYYGKMADYPFRSFTGIEGWFERLTERPAWQRVMKSIGASPLARP